MRRRRFNPTLVRLRPGPGGPSAGGGVLFQSHAGSIEAPKGVPRSFPLLEFQSHAGSIEAWGRRGRPGTSSWFQSHAGSIEAKS
mgnify:CR=1 FL=1